MIGGFLLYNNKNILIYETIPRKIDRRKELKLHDTDTIDYCISGSTDTVPAIIHHNDKPMSEHRQANRKI